VRVADIDQSIYLWLDYHAKKSDKTLIRGNDPNDPFTVLLGNLSGLTKKPGKLLVGWQYWSKAHFEEHKADFDAQFKASGVNEKQRATERQTYTHNLFNALPEDVRELHN
jgi:hypothetical protein